jgi:muramoyltetrapeptide carboxypeptidase
VIAPPALRERDLVAVIAPAFGVIPARFRGGLERLSRRLRLRVPDDIERKTGFLAGDDERRAAELDAALRDPDVRAIVVARGGYGIARILPMLDPSTLRADPKVIVGFSDVTALLSWAAYAGVRGIHGPVVSQLVDLPDEDADALVRMLRDRSPLGRLPWKLAPIGAPHAHAITGPLVGGNLTLLANLIGTRWPVAVKDAIVMCEEIGEKPYAIDRSLTHLGMTGALDGAAAMLVGDLTRCVDPGSEDLAPAFAVVDERLRRFAIAGRRGVPFGHGNRNVSLSWGARATLHPDGAIDVLDGAVA